jgi:hypothetical protein
VGMLEASPHHDDPLGPRDLQLEVGVVGHGHELCVPGLSQDGVV